MNRPFLKYGVAAVMWLMLGNANAQEIPPACEQYVTAARICGAALIHLTEYTDPAHAAQVRSQLSATEKQMTDSLRAGIQRDGSDAVAERCATSPGKEQLQKSVVNLMTFLAFNRGLSEDCQDAVASLR